VSATAPRLEFRLLTTADELAVLEEFEERIWGTDTPPVSVNVLVAIVSEGGIAMTAVDPDRDGLVVGAVFGFPTRDPEVLHSHYMAVDPGYRRLGLAVELKQRQRTWCLEQGYRAMRWTYDPLQLTNGHLNLQVLGAVGVHYHRDHYGVLGGINGSLPSDRVTVQWDLTGEVGRPAAEVAVDVLPVTPADIEAGLPAAHQARLALRAELEDRLGAGWVLVGVERDARRYLLGRT
jgi:predicted GNAT superfamily acetyltransferase